MSAPMTDLLVKVLTTSERGGLGLFQLTKDFTVVTMAAGVVTVPAGFVTDFASIPRIARWLLPQCGRSSAAALVHDWLMHEDDKRATAVFSELLKDSRSGIVRRWLMVAFVFVWTFSDLH